jgi:hypothetical protein
MKRYLACFLAVSVLSASFALAEETFNPKKCYKACMKELDDADTCAYICYDTQKNEKK